MLYLVWNHSFIIYFGQYQFVSLSVVYFFTAQLFIGTKNIMFPALRCLPSTSAIRNWYYCVSACLFVLLCLFNSFLRGVYNFCMLSVWFFYLFELFWFLKSLFLYLSFLGKVVDGLLAHHKFLVQYIRFLNNNNVALYFVVWHIYYLCLSVQVCLLVYVHLILVQVL